MGPGPAASVTPGNFLETEILGANPSLTELETRVVETTICVLASPLIDSDAG